MEQSLDFGAKLIFKIGQIGGTDVYITQTHISTLLVGIILTVIALIVRSKIKNFKEVPDSKLQNIAELLVDMFSNFTAGTMGESYRGFSYFYGPMFIFIITANLSGLLGIRPPTADLATTLALALTTFFMIHGFGIKSKGLSYFKGFLEPMPFLLPINIIGEIATPVSLSFRLFGNILGGSIIMGLIYAMMPWFITIGLPALPHLYFDVFAGSLQAFIFIMLSMTFVSSAME